MNKSLFAWLFSLCCICNCGYSQIHGIRFNAVPMPGMIATNCATYAIVEDYNGFIWMGTESGLVRYDGYSSIVVPIDSSQKSANETLIIGGLAFDQEGTLWAASPGKGIYFLKKNALSLQKQLLPETDFQDKTVENIQVDSYGRIWMASRAAHEVLVFDPQKNTAFKITLDDLDYTTGKGNIFNLLYDANHKCVWVALTNKFVVALDENSFNITNSFELPDAGYVENYFKVFLRLDAQNNLWVSSFSAGLYCINLVSGQIQHFKSSNNSIFPKSDLLRDFVFDKQGRMIAVAHTKGLEIFDFNNNSFQAINIGEEGSNSGNLEFFFPYCLLLSRNGDLWLGATEGVAVSYQTHSKIRNYPIWSTLNEIKVKGSVRSMVPFNSTEMLIGTGGQGMFCVNTATGTYKPFVPDAAIVEALRVCPQLHRTKTGIIWGGTLGNGMFRINPNTGDFKLFKPNTTGPFQPPSNSVYQVIEDKNHQLWAACIEKGVVCYSPDGMTNKIIHPKKNPLSPNAANNLRALLLAEDQNSNIWVGYSFGGVGLIQNGADSIEIFSSAYGTSKGLPSDRIQDLFIDSKNNVWVCTNGLGTAVWTGDHFTVFNEKSGSDTDNIRSITEDESGNLWMASTSEIFVYQYINGQLELKQYIPLPKTNLINYKAAGFDAEGNYIAGGLTGLFCIEKSAQVQQRTYPSVFVSEVYCVKNTKLLTEHFLLEDMLKTNCLIIGDNCHDLCLDLGIADLDMVNSIQYAYYLEGYDPNWVILEPGNRRLLYTNLPEGTFKLHLKAGTPQNHWGPETVYTIKIDVPFWNSKWFTRALYILAILLILSYLYNEIQKRNILLQKQELQLEKMKLEKTNEKLQSQVSEKTAELISQSAEIMYKTSQFEEIKEHLESLDKRQNTGNAKILQRLSNLVESDANGEDDWEKFRVYFDQANQDFTSSLIKEFPELTPKEIRHTILIRLNLSTKEIAKILNITELGVQKSRYRMKKHLQLDKDDNLIQFIMHYQPKQNPS